MRNQDRQLSSKIELLVRKGRSERAEVEVVVLCLGVIGIKVERPFWAGIKLKVQTIIAYDVAVVNLAAAFAEMRFSTAAGSPDSYASIVRTVTSF